MRPSGASFRSEGRASTASHVTSASGMARPASPSHGICSFCPPARRRLTRPLCSHFPIPVLQAIGLNLADNSPRSMDSVASTGESPPPGCANARTEPRPRPGRDTPKGIVNLLRLLSHQNRLSAHYLFLEERPDRMIRDQTQSDRRGLRTCNCAERHTERSKMDSLIGRHRECDSEIVCPQLHGRL